MKRDPKKVKRLHKALDSLHKMEIYQLNSIKQRLEVELQQMRELSEFLQTQQTSISTFADLNVRSLSSAKRRVHQLEQELSLQTLEVARAELGSNRAKDNLRQAIRQEDQKKLDRSSEEHVARLHGSRRASLR